MEQSNTVYLSLGTNKGERFENLQKATDWIGACLGEVVAVSKVYETPSWGFEGASFLNCCIALETTLCPQKLIQSLLLIETHLGRQRNSSRGYSDRVIDVDIILYNEEVIECENLQVPHPRMQERKFVLLPLIDIAADVLHPVLHKTIKECLMQCDDSTGISFFLKKIALPRSIHSQYRSIVIEGNIGAGKTSLSKRIAKDFNGQLVLERFVDNPFLARFYKDKERFAFPLETQFLVDRFHQAKEDSPILNSLKDFIISDYYISKSLLFAEITLQDEELNLYENLYSILSKEISKPDLYVYLSQGTEQLMANIQKRSRSYEQGIPESYLKSIEEGYNSYLKQNNSMKTITIDVKNIDFVANDMDYFKILYQIANC